MPKQATKYISVRPWSIEEEGFHAERNAVSESLFSIGNEYCGIRGYAEEGTIAQGLQGCYFNGIYEWGKKNNVGYKGIIKRGHYMVNALDPLKTEIFVNGTRLDIATATIKNFSRKLDFKSGVYSRQFTWETDSGNVSFVFTRFLDMVNCENLYQRVEITSDCEVLLEIYLGLDFGVRHGGRKGKWKKVATKSAQNENIILARTQTTKQYLCCRQIVEGAQFVAEEGERSVGLRLKQKLSGNLVLTKTVTSLVDKTGVHGQELMNERKVAGYENSLLSNQNYYQEFWKHSDIEILGDEENQQGVRFCIFQLQQTYHGAQPDDNIGAKGLTGEAYSGHAFWDTETYCLPYYLFNNPSAVRDLLLFRYNTLSQAKIRAKQLDCQGACYPIATLNGYEACDLWQHASLQFQPSTGVAYGIYHYVNVTQDNEFLIDYGMQMLLEICRFLRSRGEYGQDGKFGYFAVMGPDEFQMMVNHNCYTNYMAKKTFLYTVQCFEENPQCYELLGATKEEVSAFEKCAKDMFIPYDENTMLFEQHDGFFKLPHLDIKSIPVEDFPLYNHWSYDRIYRNDMIKQPDVLMLMLLFGGDFTMEQKLANYNYYEPRCIHESSLSPSVHSILACELGKSKEALDFFGFASRLDLDDYNRNTCEGLHTTSIAAAWLNIVYGFGGVRSDGKVLVINPHCPSIWRGYSFSLTYRGANIKVQVSPTHATISSDCSVQAIVCGKLTTLCGSREFPL